MPPQLAAIPAEPIPMIGYIRVSMAREEMISPEIQKAAITDWARRNNRRIVDWVPDLDQSGRNFKRKVMKAIERIEGREAVEIGLYRYDRWGRNAVESLANIKRVEMIGGKVVSVTEPYDAETAIGKYNRLNALGLAEMQSDLIADNWKAALANRTNRGLPSAGTPRFGYVRLGRVPDPVEPHRYRRDRTDVEGERYEPDYASGLADVHAEMYDRYIRLGGFRKIAVWLNSRSILNTRGEEWTEDGVRKFMDAGFGAGLLHVHDPECRCGEAATCRRRVHIPGAHPAIIDQDVWMEYLRVRNQRKTMPAASRAPAYALTSLLWCGHCFGTLRAQSVQGVRGAAFRCATWQQRGKSACPGVFPRRLYLEDRVRERLAEWAADIDQVTATALSRRTVRVSAEVDRDRLTRALADADAALTRLAVQKAKDPDMPEAVYAAAKKELLASRAQAETALAEADAAATTPQPDDFAPVLAGILDGWDMLPPLKVRDALMTLVRHVVVSRGERGKPGVEVTPVWVECSCPICEPDQA
jgi:DNA invertase Pin-like site-specific DNA recombinase